MRTTRSVGEHDNTPSKETSALSKLRSASWRIPVDIVVNNET
jgi:hypothetical protein